jgi:hypothetical protein
MKYNLAEFHWQQFEVLSLKCLVEVISTNVKSIDGGSDKGREIIYTGSSSQFRSDLSGTWIFQFFYLLKNYSDTVAQFI